MSDYGKLTGPGRLEFRREFAADIETVWQFLVDPEKRKLWFCAGRTDDFVGGKLVFDFDHSRLSDRAPPSQYADEHKVVHEAEILQIDPPHRLVFDWFESAGEEVSKVDITLKSLGDERTELHLVHTGLNERQITIGVLAGWHGHFDLLVEVLAGPRKTDFWDRDQELEAEYSGMVD